MLIYKIMHFIFGFVSFSAKGGFAERFINICSAQNIPLWNIQRYEESLTACTSAHSFLKIRVPARKSGMKIHIIKKTGLPFFIHRHKKRTGLLIGFAVFFAVLIFLSGHIWVIEVTGNKTVSEKYIADVFADSGLMIGCKKSELSITRIKSVALTDLEDISWASININGCTAVIEVRERTKSPEVEHNSNHSNIVASKDGQVEIIEPYRGTAVVKPGQTVLEGDLLISGVTESRIQSSLFSDANGYVAARTTIKTNIKCEKEQNTLIPKFKKVYSLYILGKEIPLGKSRDSKMCYTYEKAACIAGKKLPFGIIYRLYTDFDTKKKTLSKEQNILMATDSFALQGYHDTLHAQIYENDVKITALDNYVEVRGTFSGFENICKRVEFEVEELPDNMNNEESVQQQ